MKSIHLPCSSQNDLNWSSCLPSLEEKGPFFWIADLSIDIPLEDELLFQSVKFALSHFSKTVFPTYEKKSLGFCLYQGSIDFNPYFCWTSHQEESFSLWAKEKKSFSEKQLKRLFYRDSYALYFQMLSHALPDELEAYLIFDHFSDATLAERLQLLSKERFEHFSLVAPSFKGWNGLIWEKEKILPASSAPIALCFPEEEVLDQKLLERIDQLLETLPSDIRVIPEPFLTEMWEGVDELFVLEKALSSRGKRKIAGFLATGGEVHYL